ncbi:MAG TPA: enoyl-CoA hydratase/isomerase family protein [Candidatus Dormibacteraeota bacterium]
MGELVRVERRDAIAIVTINRPEVRNALNPAALADLRAALEFVGRNPAVACAILAGEGGTFTTGDDLTETAAMEDAGFADMIEGFQSITRALRAMAMPVIAAIEGYAVGGGLEIAAACDLRVCAEDTIFFCPEVRLGLLMSNGSSSILPRLIGAGRTRELMLTGRRFDAGWAERAGLVNRVVPRGEVLAAAVSMAGEVAANQLTAVRMTKQLLNRVEDAEVTQALAAETQAAREAFADPAAVAALKAELERWAARRR